MKKTLASVLAVLAFQLLYGLALKDAYEKIPEIIEDPHLIEDVVFELDGTNKAAFVEAVRKAASNYPGSSNAVSRLNREIDYYADRATNSRPNTVLMTSWNTQLEFQNRARLQNLDSSSRWEWETSAPDGSSSVSTQPFTGSPKAYRFSPANEPRGYSGQ